MGYEESMGVGVGKDVQDVAAANRSGSTSSSSRSNSNSTSSNNISSSGNSNSGISNNDNSSSNDNSNSDSKGGISSPSGHVMASGVGEPTLQIHPLTRLKMCYSGVGLKILSCAVHGFTFYLVKYVINRYYSYMPWSRYT